VASDRAGVIRRFGFAHALLFTFLAASSSMAAEPSAEDKEIARNLMDRGDRLVGEKDFSGALKAYEAAHKIMNVPTTGIEVAKAEVVLGKLIAARDEALLVEHLPATANEPTPFIEARRAAADLAKKLEAKIPTLHIEAKNPHVGVETHAELDDQAIDLDKAQQIDPGKHVVRVTSGTDAREVEIEVEAGRSVPVVFDFDAPYTGRSYQFFAQPFGKKLSPLAIGAFAVGAVGAGVGTIAGIVAFAKTSSVKSDCTGNACPGFDSGRIASAQSAGNVSTAFFVIGGLGAAVGVASLFFFSNRDADHANVHISPVIGVGSAGVIGTF
jgi:hypothetical protein